MADNISKAYDVRILGSTAVIKELDVINDRFTEIKHNKEELNKLASTSIEDPQLLKQVKEKLSELKVEEKELLNEQRKKRIELVELSKVRKQQLIDSANQKKAAKEEAASNEVLAGSYDDINKRYKELRKIATSTVSLTNKEEVQEAITELKQYKKLLDDFNRGLSPDGTLVGEYTQGIVEAFRRMGLDDVIRSQITGAREELTKLDDDFDKLEQELREVRAAGKNGFNDIEREMIENRRAAEQLSIQIEGVEASLRDTQSVGDSLTASMRANFKTMKRDAAGLLVSYISVQEGIGALRVGIRDAKELSDKTTDIEIELGKGVGAADNLIAKLSQFNTRDKLKELEEIANIAQRAGVLEENLESVTIAIDKAKIAFGQDFGDIEQGTETLIKLINIFYEDGQITGDRILYIANTVRTLANETVASVPFINDFSGRMAGLKGIAEVTLPQVIGLGAGFESFKQSAEVSSTALIKVIPQLARDTEKFAQVAGLSKEAFEDLVNNNPIEALLKVSEGLVKDKSGLVQLSESLEDADIKAGRLTAVIGVLGEKADVFRDNINRANTAITQTTAVEDAFIAKNTNLAATLDKVGKKFSDVAGSKAFQNTLLAVASVITFLLGNMPAVITLLGLWGLGWAFANKQLLINKAVMLALNVQIAAYRAVLAITTIAQTAYTVGLNLFTGATTRAAAATTLLSNALRLTPLGIILTLLALVTAGVTAFASAVRGSTRDLRNHAIQMRVNNDVQRRMEENTVSVIAKMKTLLSVVKDNTASLDTRKRALKDLIAINPDYLNTLTLENVKTKEGTKLLQDFIKQLRIKAALEAANAVRDEKLRKDVKLQNLEYSLQKRVSTGKGLDYDDLTDEEKQYVNDTRSRFPFFSSSVDAFVRNAGPNPFIAPSAANAALQAVKKERELLAKELDVTDGIIKDKYQKIGDTIKKGPDTAGTGDGGSTDPGIRTPKIIRDDIKAITAELDNYDKASDKAKELRTKLKALRKELRQALGTDDGSSGDPNANKIRDIDAIRDTELAKEQARYLQLQKTRELNLNDEVEHLNKVNAANQKAIDEKLKIIKGGTASERKQIAELHLDRIENEANTNLAIYKLRLEDLNNQRKTLELEAKNKLDAIEADPTKSDVEKAAAKSNYFDTLLAIQKDFNEKVETLEVQYGQQAKDTANKRYQELLELRRKFDAAKADSIKTSNENEIDEIDKQFADTVNTIRAKFIAKAKDLFLSSLSPKNRQAEIKKLSAQTEADIIQAEVDRINKQIALNEYQHDQNLISDERYYKRKAELNQQWLDKMQSLNNEEVKKQREKEESIDRIKQQAQRTFDAITNAYFATQSARIDKIYEERSAYIDSEKEKRLEQANSREEEQAIEDEFQQKQKQLEKQRANDRKDLARKQLAIEFALASIKAFSTSATFAEGIVKEGLVFAEYLAKLAVIDSQQFARGGEVPRLGGEFGGNSHGLGGTKFLFQGRSFEAEAKELAIINKKSATDKGNYTVSGTPKQIASAINSIGGGTDFAPGASLFAYGGNLGRSLGVPSLVQHHYASKALGGGNNEALTNLILKSYDAIVSTNSRIDRIQVVLNPNEVSENNQERTRKVKLGAISPQ